MATWSWQTFFLFFVVLGSSCFCLKQYDIRDSEHGREWLVLSMIPGSLLLGLRAASVGKDLVRYEMHIRSFRSFAWGDVFSEPFMSLIEGFCSNHNGIHSFIIITSVIEFIFLGIALSILHKKNYKTKLVFALIYSYIVIRSTSMVSNGIGAMCAFCAIFSLLKPRCTDLCNNRTLDEDKSGLIPYFVYTAIGICFHNSIWINIPLYFLCKPIVGDRKVWLKRLLKVFILIGLILFFYLYSRGVFNPIVYMISSGDYRRFMSTTLNFGWGNIITRLPLILLAFYNWKKIEYKFGDGVTPFKYLLLFDLIMAQMRYISPDFERITMVTGIGPIFVLTLLYEVFKDRFRDVLPLITPIIVVLYMSYNLYLWGVLGNYGLMPYVFW